MPRPPVAVQTDGRLCIVAALVQELRVLEQRVQHLHLELKNDEKSIAKPRIRKVKGQGSLLQKIHNFRGFPLLNSLL